MAMLTIPISDCKNLEIKVYVIGYTECGESIIMLFIDNKNKDVLYAVVIDSYKLSDGTFKTVDFLKANGVKHIDVICWTHPDTDHTKGIDELVNNYCDKKSKILIPIYINGKKSDPIKYNANDKAIINSFFDYSSRFTKVVKPVAAISGGWGNTFTVCFNDNLHEVITEFKVASPHADYLIEDIRQDKDIHKNHFSICMMVKIGPYKFDFCGDIENRTINNMVDEPFDNPLFLKIPHHSSKGSCNILKRLRLNSPSISCTTTYDSQGLPDTMMVEEYKERFEYFFTTGLNKDTDTPKYGIVELNFNFFDKKEVNIKCHGHAHREI